jgi:hypothetical protein
LRREFGKLRRGKDVTENGEQDSGNKKKTSK